MFCPNAYYDGNYQSLDKISISATDLAVHRGYSIFDFFKFNTDHNPYINWYFDRLYNSAEFIHLPLASTRQELEQICTQLLEKNNLTTGYIKLILSAGESHDGFTPTGDPKLLAMAMPYKRPSSHYYSKGAKLHTKRYLRDIPHVKTTNYLYSAALSDEMQGQEAIDILYHDGQFVSECSRSNIFIVKDQQIITPDKDILLGITRKKVLTLTDPPLPIVERPVQLSEIYESEEVFITSTMKGVMPVVQINEVIIGTGHVGKVTIKLMARVS